MTTLRLGVMLVFGLGGVMAAEWQRLDGCVFVRGRHSDGDSIEVKQEGRRWVFRLYFVDCVETSRGAVERRAAQAGYFGVSATDDRILRKLGRDAAAFTAAVLREPFTVWTRWERVEQDGTNPSLRAFVTTSSGRDLAELLVENGHAIIRGGPALADHPTGRSAAELLEELRRDETRARIAGRGAWAGALDPRWLPVGAGGREARSGNALAATATESLLAAAGQSVRVEGIIASVGWSRDRGLAFLNFVGCGRADFVAVIHRENQDEVLAEHFDNQQSRLVGREVEVRGMVTLYRDRPQMTLTSADQLRVVAVERK